MYCTAAPFIELLMQGRLFSHVFMTLLERGGHDDDTTRTQSTDTRTQDGPARPFFSRDVELVRLCGPQQYKYFLKCQNIYSFLNLHIILNFCSL